MTCVAYESFISVAQARAGGCECVNDSIDDATIQGWIDAASDTIAAATGMRIAGQIAMKARPCRFSPGQCCTCCGLDAIWLGSDPLVSVDAVRIDGNVVPDSWWQVHHSLIGPHLVRVGPADQHKPPPCWPSYQKRWLDDGFEDTWSIDFTVGACMDSPIIFDAVMELICDEAAQYAGDKVYLESGVVTATMGGVTVTVDPDRVMRLATGAIGPATTKMMGLLSPGGRQPFGEVWSPELLGGWNLYAQPILGPAPAMSGYGAGYHGGY